MVDGGVHQYTADVADVIDGGAAGNLLPDVQGKKRRLLRVKRVVTRNTSMTKSMPENFNASL